MKSIDNPNGVVGSLKDSVDDILGLRDSLGAALMPVYFVERQWTGDESGDGTATETTEQVLPSPRIVSMSDDSRVMEGGAIQLDDILLKGISKNKYPSKVDVDGTTDDQSIERFYEIDGQLYGVINVTEKHLTWNVQVRKLSNQKRHPAPTPPPDPEPDPLIPEEESP